MTDQPEMIERVARAIYAELHPEKPPTWEHLPLSWQASYRKQAHAAIAAMREPTFAMLEKGPGDPYMDRDTWPAMIDAALEGK
jgi:hypothetical protein